VPGGKEFFTCKIFSQDAIEMRASWIPIESGISAKDFRVGERYGTR